MPDSTESIPALLVRLSRAVREQYGVTALDLDIHTAERQRPLSLPFPPSCETPADPAPNKQAETSELTSTERSILRAVTMAESEEPTAEEIAEHVKPKLPNGNDQYLRKLLSGLRKRGYLGGEYKAKGYPLTPKGFIEVDPNKVI